MVGEESGEGRTEGWKRIREKKKKKGRGGLMGFVVLWQRSDFITVFVKLSVRYGQYLCTNLWLTLGFGQLRRQKILHNTTKGTSFIILCYYIITRFYFTVVSD